MDSYLLIMLLIAALVLSVLGDDRLLQQNNGNKNRRSPNAMNSAVKSGGVKKKVVDEEFVPPQPPEFADLSTKPTSNLHTDQAFIDACKNFAGYYKDAAKRPDLSKTIMLVGINNGYRDFFHNFKCYMDRLGIKFLPISLDAGIYAYLTNNNLGPTVLLSDIPGRDSVASEASGFGGKNFNLIGCRKMEAVGAALRLGYDVIFSDVDIAMLRDPIDDLFLPGIDYVHSTNKGCGRSWRFNETMEGNTGFYAVKSSLNTISVWDYTYRACSQAPAYDDQTINWLIIRYIQSPLAYPLDMCPVNSGSSSSSSSSSSGSDIRIAPASIYGPIGSRNVDLSNTQTRNQFFVTCPLNDCKYSASQLKDYGGVSRLQETLSMMNEKAVMIHANWMNGHGKKKDALLNVGLWITRQVITEEQEDSNRDSHWTCITKINSVFI